MRSVFIAYNRRDIQELNSIVNYFEPMNKGYKFIYYQPNTQDKTSLDHVLFTLLPKADFFVVLLSENSLKSHPVQLEISEAFKLSRRKIILKICPIIIDDNIANTDNRIPEDIKQKIHRVTATISSAKIIEREVIQDHTRCKFLKRCAFCKNIAHPQLRL